VIPAAAEGQASTHSYFLAGRAAPGWQFVLGEGDGARTMFSAAVGKSESGALQVTAVDRSAQEDARLLKWSGSGAATAALQGANPIDLQREANGQLSLTFDYRVDAAPTSAVTVAIECGANCRGDFPIDSRLKQGTAGEWRQLKLPLHCFQSRGADLRHVTAPFALTTAGKLELGIANVRLESGLNDSTGCD
jgi:beta-glucosidase